MSRRSVLVWAALVGLLGGLVGTSLVLFVRDQPKIKVGNVAEWLAGIGTIGALLYAGRALHLDLESRKQTEDRFALAEARRVLLKLTASAGHRTNPGGQLEVFGEGRIDLENQSLGDLRDVDIGVYFGMSRVETITVGELAAGATRVLSYSKTWPPGNEPSGEHQAEVRFVDAAGRGWAVRSEGSLRRIF